MAEEKTKRYSLDKPLCQDNTEVQSAEYTDHYINGVTYRVWSAFEGKTNVADSLSRLMFWFCQYHLTHFIRTRIMQ